MLMTSQSNEVIERNIQARNAARDFIAEADAFAKGTKEDRFWEHVAIEAAARAGLVVVEDVPGIKIMPDARAAEFEKQLMTGGKFKGVMIKDVDLAYLQAIVDDKFKHDLERYLRSPYFRRRRG